MGPEELPQSPGIRVGARWTVLMVNIEEYGMSLVSTLDDEASELSLLYLTCESAYLSKMLDRSQGSRLGRL